MTKPQFSPEPSMEDILASIRKMISEERLGPRPIPDQIGRSPFGESVAEKPAPDPLSLEPHVEPAPASVDRSTPSFSSLSDALKAASPAPQRRTLEEKIADMLENGDAMPRPVTPSDSLAVFTGGRPSPTTSPDAGAFRPSPRVAEPSVSERPGARHVPGTEDSPRAAPRPARPPEAPFNGAAHRRDEDAARARSAPAMPKVVAPASEPKETDTQRIIAMPARHGADQASGPAGPAMNGTNVSSLGLRPFPGGAQNHRPVPAPRDADTSADKRPDSNTGVTARSPDGVGSINGTTPRSPDGVGSVNGAKPRSPDGVGSINGVMPRTPDAVGSKSNKADDGSAHGPTKVARPPQTPRDEAAKPPSAEMPRPVDTSTSTRPAPGHVAKKAEAPTADGAAKTAPEQASAKPAIRAAPSDALVDAVVALVHKEPDTMSVFTSSSAFVHGVGAHEFVGPTKPGPNAARKLDRSAAELLRPMLRQWLSENMPRIVEEALRSELMSSQSKPEDSEEA